jgi:predicted metal-dependent HD superfamily phosphohydrolase
MKPDERELLTIWYQLWLGLNSRSPALAPLLARYGEAHRHYHNATHILDCLHHLDAAPPLAGGGDLAGEMEARPLLQLALFYHDAVYDPRSGENEAASAEIARQELSHLLPDGAMAAVVRLIHITDHRSAPAAADEQLIVDIDLAILGQAPQVFDHYERGIRKEYAHVPEEQFRAGRARILAEFLKRPRLFHHPWFFKQYEAQARANLARSLHQLSPVPVPAQKGTRR